MYPLVEILVPQRVHQQHRQLGITIRNVRHFVLLIRERLDDLPQSEQRFVDICCLLCHFSLRFRLLQPLTASEVHKRYFSIPFDASALAIALPYHVDSHERVAPGGILVQLVTSRFPILYPLVEHCNQIIDAGAVDNHKILHEEAIRRIPSAVQHSRIRVQEVLYLLVIDLSE